MNRSIGFRPPILALVIAGVLFNKWTLPYFPKVGWAKIFWSLQTYFFLSSVIILLVRRVPLSHIGLPRKGFLRHVALGLGLGLSPAVLTAFLVAILTMLDSWFHFLPRPFFGGPPLPYRYDIPTLVSLIVMAPITEELFFRGVLLRSLRDEYGVRIAIVFSAVVFMWGHGLFAIGPLLLGLITAPVTLWCGSIVPGILFHAFCNFYGPLMVWYFPNLFRYLSFFFQ